MPKTDEQFVADLAKRIRTRCRDKHALPENLAFAVVSLVVGQIVDDARRHDVVTLFRGGLAQAVARYRIAVRDGKIGS